MRDYYKQYERTTRSKICQEVGISFRELGHAVDSSPHLGLRELRWDGELLDGSHR